jgi:hypothetical protein
LIESTENTESDYLMLSVYPVIGEPPLFGSIHYITTSSGFQYVTGGYGLNGI